MGIDREDFILPSIDEIMDEINNGNQIVICNDPKICMINGGSTSVWKKNNDYLIFSEGQNWRDQENTEISEEKLRKMFEEILEEAEKEREDHEDFSEFDEEDKIIEIYT